MKKLNLFIGPPSNRNNDYEAVMMFISEKGDKVILGGTTVSIFERILNTRAEMNIDSYSEGVPPFGNLEGIAAMEASITLSKLNNIFFERYPHKNAVSFLKKKIMTCDAVKIYFGGAHNPANGINKTYIINEFLEKIKLSGLVPEIVDYQE